MDEAMKTILKVLAEKISSLEVSIWLRDNQIAELKKEWEGLKKERAKLLNERVENDG